MSFHQLANRDAVHRSIERMYNNIWQVMLCTTHHGQISMVEKTFDRARLMNQAIASQSGCKCGTLRRGSLKPHELHNYIASGLIQIDDDVK